MIKADTRSESIAESDEKGKIESQIEDVPDTRDISYVPPLRTDASFEGVLTRRDPLANARRIFTTTGKGTVAFLGGSITQMEGWRVKVMAELQRRFPQTEFNFICAGLSSTCSDTGAYRLEENILSKGTPDLFFVEYAVNDSGDGYYLAGRHDPATYQTHSLRGIEGVVRHVRTVAPHCDMVMTFFVTESQLRILRAGRTPETYATDMRVAEHYGVTTVNIGRSVVNGEKEGTFTWQDYGGDCHPHEPGCLRIAEEYARLFDLEWSGIIADSLIPHPLPEKPLDAFCYQGGGYLPLTEVKLGAGWQVAPVDWGEVGGNCRPDYREGEMLTSVIPGAECEFSFQGTAVGAFVLAGPDCGSLEVAVDGGAFTDYLMFSPYSQGGLHYPFVETFADGLDAGKTHTVRMRVGAGRHSDSCGNAVRIYRLCVNRPAENISARREIHAVQLDVARQMETPEFIKKYIDRLADFGINTLELYLEGRFATPTFSLPPAEAYSVAEMRDIVAHAAAKGIEIVPVVSLLGHAEHFFKYPGRDELSEEHLGGATFGGTRKTTFCLSNPRTREFLDKYIGELTEIFPSKNFHVGFDESWNMGRCPLCRSQAEKDGGDALFAEFVNFAHDLLAKYGRRMWMWDDFFTFHRSALDKTPRDVMLLHWNYSAHISSRGARDNFGGHERHDYLAEYARLGFETLVVSWYDTRNILSLADYGRKHQTAGWVFGQWEEKFSQFHGAGLPRALAWKIIAENPGKALCGDPFRLSARRIFPTLSETEIDAVTQILHAAPTTALADSIAGAAAKGFTVETVYGVRLAVSVLENSVFHPGTGAVASDPLSECALLDDLVSVARTGLLDDAMRRIAGALTDPCRRAADVVAAKEKVRELSPEAEALAARRNAQAALWRPGLENRTAKAAQNFLRFAEEVIAIPETSASVTEKRLEMCLTLVDYYGRPNWKVEGRFDNEWREIAKGGWKPMSGEWAAFQKYVTFIADSMPTQVRVTYDGIGAAELRYLQIEDCTRVTRPEKILTQSGMVRNAENLLVDDAQSAVFGAADAMNQVRNSTRERIPAVVEIKMR